MFNRRPTAARPNRSWQQSKSFWIVAALVLLLVIASAASSGFGGIILMLGLVALITGLYALLTKRKTWVRLPHRKSAGIVASLGAIALLVGTGVIGATAAPSAPVVNKAALVASQPATTTATPTPTPTPTATNPARTACLSAAATQAYQGAALVCTQGTDGKLLWLPEAESKVIVKAAADKKAAEDKAAAEKLAAEKQAAADKVAAEKAVADQAAADAAAAEAARLAGPPAPAAPYVPAAPAGPNVVHPGAFCSGGVGVTSTGKPMVCAPAKDGKMRWIGA